MSKFEILKETALSFPETVEAPHFEKTSFKVKKKIFATYSRADNRASIKLSLVDQDVFSAMSKETIYPIPNKWGTKGWTLVELGQVEDELLIDAIRSAYIEVAPKKLSNQIRRED